MGLNQSKLRPIRYSCYEVGHTWTPSCSASGLEVGMFCFKEALKIYSSVYGASALLRGKLPTISQLIRISHNVLQSTAFLSFNALFYVFYICAIRHVLGYHNYYTVGWLAAFLSSFSAILVERPSRRTPLAVYVNTVMLESWVTKHVKEGTLPLPVPYGDVLLFSLTSATLMWLFKAKSIRVKEVKEGQTKGKDTKEEDSDFMFTLIRMMVGKSEGFDFRQKPALNPDLRSRLKIASFSLNFISRKNLQVFADRLTRPNTTVCPHSGHCVNYGAKGFLLPFAGGALIQTALYVLRLLRSRKTFHPAHLLSYQNLQLGLFLGSFSGIYKTVTCFWRRLLQEDTPLLAVPAGFLAGLAMTFYRSTSLSIYAFMKAIEILCRQGVAAGYLPKLPLIVELVYSVGTAGLFHTGLWEPHNLKPSYLAFMKRVTGDRFWEMNRDLLAFEYGTDSNRIVKLRPNFREDQIGDRLKRLLPIIYPSSASTQS